MIVFLLLIIKVNAALNPYGPTVINDFTSCVNNLIENNFEKPGLLIFGHTDNVTSLVANVRAGVLKRIHERLLFSVTVAIPDDRQEVCDVDNDIRVPHRDHFNAIMIADYVVIIVDNFKNFVYLTNSIIRSSSWNPYAKFVIFLINFTYNESERVKYVENILSCLFKYNVINVLVAVPQPGNIRNALIYSWTPYDPPKYCGYYNETAKDRLILENTCRGGVLKEKKKLFYNKVPKNMMKCVINIFAIKRQPFVSSVNDDPNIEMILVNAMLTTFNFSVNYTIINEFRGERDNAGKWNGALEILVAEKGDILLGGIFPDWDVHEDFEWSSSYLADSYTWVVPKADPSPPWMALTIIFRTFVWYTIGVIFILCVLLWRFLGILSDDSKYHKSFAHCFLNTCIITLGFSAYVRPVTRSLRIFFVFMNLYCILLITAYQTKLIQVLQNPTSENQVDTIEELVDSGLKLGGTEELQDLFSNSNDPFDNVINNKWIVVDEVSDALVDVAVHKNFSVLCSRLELAHLSAIMPELNDRSGNLRYYTFEWNTFSVPAEMLALKGFPFMGMFSATLGGFKRLGINDGVRRHFAKINLRKRTKLLLSLNVQSSKFSPLSTRHLQSGFLMLCLGMGAGFVVFVYEILVRSKRVRQCFSKLRRREEIRY